MSTTDDFTRWVSRLGHGDPQAAERLWDEYFCKLVEFARRKLVAAPLRIADEEDVALSAMASFCSALKAGRLARVREPGDLWRLLLTITARKLCAQRRRQHAAKRGGGLVRGESALDCLDESRRPARGIEEVLGDEPTPELACSLAEDCRRLLDRLGDAILRQVAIDTLEGFTTAEIAEKLGCLQRTVQRKLVTIREIWSLEAPS